METNVTDTENCYHHNPGITQSFSLHRKTQSHKHFLLSLFLQLVSFGLSNEMMVTFKEENLMTFRNLFLKGYKDQKLGGYALYTKVDTYDHIFYIIKKVVTRCLHILFKDF